LYLNDIQNSLKTNPNQFWSFIKNFRSSSLLPNTLSLEHRTANNGQSIVILFSHYFSSTYINENIPITSNNSPRIESPDSINIFQINLIDVFTELENLKIKTGIDPDGLSPIFLQACKFVLSPPITYLFNASLANSCFPSLWKSTFITPILKKGDKSLITNYRSISLISILPKLFSKIVNNKLTPLFKNILSPQQHG